MGWGIGYDEDDSRTESYAALHQVQGWSNFNLLLDMPLSEIRENPSGAQKSAKAEERGTGLWRPIHNRRIKKNVISVAAERPFKAEGDRELELGTTRKWAVGFFNGGQGVFSSKMDLILDNEPTEIRGPSRGNRPKLVKEPIDFTK